MLLHSQPHSLCHARMHPKGEVNKSCLYLAFMNLLPYNLCNAIKPIMHPKGEVNKSRLYLAIMNLCNLRMRPEGEVVFIWPYNFGKY